MSEKKDKSILDWFSGDNPNRKKVRDIVNKRRKKDKKKKKKNWGRVNKDLGIK